MTRVRLPLPAPRLDFPVKVKNMNNKIIKIIACGAFLMGLFVFFTVQNANAQTKSDCFDTRNKESYQCLLRSGECSDACQEKTKKPDGSRYFNSGEIYTTCMKKSECSAKSDACDKKTQESYRSCLDDISTKPPEQSPETPAQSADDQQLPEEIIVDGTTHVPALVGEMPTENMFNDSVFVEGSDMEKDRAKSELCAGASCTISVKFQGGSKTAKSEICAGASCTISVKFQMKTADLVVTQPKLIFNTKDTGSSFTIDVGKWLVDAKTEKGTSELSDTEASGIFQEKLAEILNREQATEVDFVTVEVGSPPPVPIERLSQSEYNFQRYQLQNPSILLQLDQMGPNPYKVPAGLAVYPGSNVRFSVIANTDSVGGPKIVAEVSAGNMIYIAGRSSSASDFLSAVSGYGVSHKKTAYGIAHDPESGKSVIEIYDGEIEIFDRQTGKVLASLSTIFGADIKRIEIDADGNMKEKIAIPQSEWSAFVAKHQKNRSGVWLYVFGIAIIGAAAYLAYRNKDEIMKIIKKQPTQ